LGMELFTEFFSILHAISKSVILRGSKTEWVYMAPFITHRLEGMVQRIAKKIKIKKTFFYTQINVCLASSTNNHILSIEFLTLPIIRHLWPFNETVRWQELDGTILIPLADSQQNLYDIYLLLCIQY
jgi:hypothetical protein